MGQREGHMQTRRLICSVLLILLAGCSDPSELRRENALLRQSIAEHQAERTVELAQLERQASIAAGCDWLLPICPEYVTRPGRKAQQAGFGGGDDWPFWTVVILKMIALGGLIGTGIVTIDALWEYLVRPLQAESERSRALIQGANAKAAHAHQAAREAERDTELLRQQLRDLESEIAARTVELQELQEQIESCRINLDTVVETRRALDEL